MVDRLSALDASFLYAEGRATAMNTGSVMVFSTPEEGFDHGRLLRHVTARVAFVPRYRQRVLPVPGRLANPVWVDDEAFDASYHVRRTALPRPGTDDQLRELVARVMARHLSRERPLWEVYLVDGLTGDRFAIITKTHAALVDGIAAVDIGQVVLDDAPDAPQPPSSTWRPSREPTVVELVTAAVAEYVGRPAQAAEAVRVAAHEVVQTAATLAGAVTGAIADPLPPAVRQRGTAVLDSAAAVMLGAARTARTAARPAPGSSLNVEVSEHRRFAMVVTDLQDYRRVRTAHARRRGTGVAGAPALGVPDRRPDRMDVNDVVLATLAGAMRAWLLARGESVLPATLVRALVPVSVGVLGEERGAVGRVETLLVDLPVGEPSPVMRLHQVAYQMLPHRESGRAVSARSLASIAGFAPPTLHSLGIRMATGLSHRLFNLVITNVPGPQQPLYAAGARMVGTYPVVPLSRGQALTIGLTSYDGAVYYGLLGDRTALADLDVLATSVTDALAELVETSPRVRRPAPQTRTGRRARSGT